MKTTILAAALLALAPLGASHPHFNDGGALPWSTTLADAQKSAAKAGKLIFVEFGREA
jgi:hypothetical protein